jgi:hypothetical protein
MPDPDRWPGPCSLRRLRLAAGHSSERKTVTPKSYVVRVDSDVLVFRNLRPVAILLAMRTGRAGCVLSTESAMTGGPLN